MIWGVILASGFSRRMGRSKLTLKISGRTLLQRALDAALGAKGIERVLVVVRPEQASQVQRPKSKAGRGDPDLGLGTLDFGLLLNDRAAEGQSAGIRLAAERLAADPDCEGAIFSVVDQPFLGPEVFESLVEAWRQGRAQILASSYAGQRGNPVLFGRRFFPELSRLEGDVGGREVLARHPEAVAEVAMPDPRAGWDVDTWEDYERARRHVERADLPRDSP